MSCFTYCIFVNSAKWTCEMIHTCKNGGKTFFSLLLRIINFKSVDQYSICRSSWVWHDNQILSVRALEKPSPVRYDIVLVLVRSSPEIALIWSLWSDHSWWMAVGITWLYLLLTNGIQDGGGGGESCGTRKEVVGGVGQIGREEANWGEMTAHDC